MDLTPRSAPEPKRSSRRVLPIVVAVLASVAGLAIVVMFLTSSIDYYCNVDEVGVRSGCEGTRRLRVQGAVDEGSLKKAAGMTTFSMSFNEDTLEVRYDGDPGGVFQECIPVVAHGRMVNGVFLSDRIEVKHSNAYSTENKERIDKAEAAACSLPMQ
jgi:cytochrome c-type biogenesis protein CcmE